MTLEEVNTKLPIGMYVLCLRGLAIESPLDAVTVWKRDRSYFLRKLMKSSSKQIKNLNICESSRSIHTAWLKMADDTITEICV